MRFTKLIFALFILTTACIPTNTPTPTTPEVHSLINNPLAKFLWSQDYPEQMLPAQMLVATPDRIIASIYGFRINAFDSKTGKAAWEVWKEETEPTILKMVAQDSIVYTAKHDELTALDAKTGALIWDIKNLNTGSALNLFVDRQNIFVQHQHQTEKHMVVVNSSGKVAGTINRFSFQRIWSIDDDVAYYANGNSSLNAFDLDENQIKWRANVEDLNFQQSVTAENMIYLDAGDWIDNNIISAVEKISGKVIWRKETHKNIISNLCILDDNLYFLTSDGFLIGIDRNSGQESMKLEFTNVPFILYRNEPQVTNYLIAADNKNKILAIAFGDSFELMAIQILDP